MKQRADLCATCFLLLIDKFAISAKSKSVKLLITLNRPAVQNANSKNEIFFNAIITPKSRAMRTEL